MYPIVAAEKNVKESLLEQVRRACQRLGPHGWNELFAAQGLNVDASDFARELLRPLTGIDRSHPGFEDFSVEGQRGIEPGRPARSLLYHAFASPQVVRRPDGARLGEFPTPAEIEAVENLVFGLVPPSIDELRARVGNAPLAIVVFAAEYRPSIGTVHQHHADLCFSRAGVSRVGTADSHYLPEARGYLPFHDGDPRKVRVLPCRYSAYVAAQMPGNADRFGPLRFQTRPKSDAERNFWVPVHKLFSGSECLRDGRLTVNLRARHSNEKLRRVHLALAGEGVDTGWHEPEISQPPFVFAEGIAEFSTDPRDGQGLLVPIVHPALVEIPQRDGEPLSFVTPANRDPFRSSIIIESTDSGARKAPEYVHARLRLEDDGSVTDLNSLPDMVDVIRRGGYRAVHFIDHTGDGFIEVDCPELALEIPRTQAAYSMVGAVDFFPLVNQQQLMQWWNQSAPPELEGNIWPSNPGPPEALCDTRFPANQSLLLDKLTVNGELRRHNQPRQAFSPQDDTVSAVVGLWDSTSGRLTRIDPPVNDRITWLTDGASGVFAPGWDTSIDRTEEIAQDDGSVTPGVTHFNNYGLGSPFPEDALLCAALSSFWPAAAPDVTRTFAPRNYATATPLTDDQLGLTGTTPWDGILGPVIPDPDVNEVEYRQLEYGDYVQAALTGQFEIGRIGRMTAREYLTRTLVMARAYAAVNATTREQKRAWAVFSFMPVATDDEELRQAQAATGVTLHVPSAYRFRMFEHRPVSADRKPANHRNKLVAFTSMVTIYADPRTALVRNSDGVWTANRY